MGKGDKKTRKGKIVRGSYGVLRPRKKNVPVLVKNEARPADQKVAKKEQIEVKKEEKPESRKIEAEVKEKPAKPAQELKPDNPAKEPKADATVKETKTEVEAEKKPAAKKKVAKKTEDKVVQAEKEKGK